MAEKKEKTLNKGAVAARETANNDKDKTQDQINKEMELDLSIWISNLSELQGDLIEAVDKGKVKAIKKIEAEILGLKGKIRAGMNALSGVDTAEDYQAIITEAREIMEKSVPKAKKVVKKIPVKKKLSDTQLKGLKKLKGVKKLPKKKKKAKPFNIFTTAVDEDGPLSERLMLLQTSMIDILTLTKELVESNPYAKQISKEAERTWIANMEIALDMDHGHIQSLDKTMTDTIEAIQDAEIAEEEDV